MSDLAPGTWKCKHDDTGITFIARCAEGKELSTERALQIANAATDLLVQLFKERGVPITFARQDLSWVNDGDDTITVRFKFPVLAPE